jgi:hypothetical protein
MKMTSYVDYDPSDDPQLLQIAEASRGRLDTSFFQYRDYVETKLENSEWPEPLRFYSAETSVDESQARLVDLIVAELHLLLCTTDNRYKDVRSKGKIFSQAALPAVAAYVAGACGISVGLATGGVAFIAIAVFRVGVGVFCRVSSGAKAKDAKS